MGDQYIGEIRMFAGNYAPQGWAFCNGQILSISQNDVLYSLIGNAYGGDGQTTFALPNLQGRIPMHLSSVHPLTQSAGTETVTLQQVHLPAHSHLPQAAAAAGDIANPTNNVWAANGSGAYATDPTGAIAMNPQTISAVGNGQAHANMMPYLAISYIIALEGLYPTFD